MDALGFADLLAHAVAAPASQELRLITLACLRRLAEADLESCVLARGSSVSNLVRALDDLVLEKLDSGAREDLLSVLELLRVPTCSCYCICCCL